MLFSTRAKKSRAIWLTSHVGARQLKTQFSVARIRDQALDQRVDKGVGQESVKLMRRNAKTANHFHGCAATRAGQEQGRRALCDSSGLKRRREGGAGNNAMAMAMLSKTRVVRGGQEKFQWPSAT